MSISLLTGVTGLTAAQDLLDVVGNNLANLNTTGFKSQTPLFSDLLYQTLVPASASNNGSGVNPVQVGYGTQTATVDTNFTEGGADADRQPARRRHSRARLFHRQQRRQRSVTRRHLQYRCGWLPGRSSNRLPDSAPGIVGQASTASPGFQTQGNTNIQLPIGTGIPGKASADITLTGNLRRRSFRPAGPDVDLGEHLPDQYRPGHDRDGSQQSPNNIGRVSGRRLDCLAGHNGDRNDDCERHLERRSRSTLGDVVNAINAIFPARRRR